MIRLEYDEQGKLKHNGHLYTAIKELAQKLTEIGIPYEMREFYDGYQIYTPSYSQGQWEGDAIEYICSYGAEENLLEVYGFGLEEPDGYLTVDEALKYFVEWHNERKQKENNA